MNRNSIGITPKTLPSTTTGFSKKPPYNDYKTALIHKAKTFSHPDIQIEWLLWHIAIALEDALDEINRLKSSL